MANAVKDAIEQTSAEIWGDGLGYVLSLSSDELETAKNLVDYISSTIKQATTAQPSEYREFADSIREMTGRLLSVLKKYGLANRKSTGRFVTAVNAVLAILER